MLPWDYSDEPQIQTPWVDSWESQAIAKSSWHPEKNLTPLGTTGTRWLLLCHSTLLLLHVWLQATFTAVTESAVMAALIQAQHLPTISPIALWGRWAGTWFPLSRCKVKVQRHLASCPRPGILQWLNPGLPADGCSFPWTTAPLEGTMLWHVDLLYLLLFCELSLPCRFNNLNLFSIPLRKGTCFEGGIGTRTVVFCRH